jgi:hypothetical protein
MSKGFIPVKRTLFEHFLFKERRVFSRFEAWLDLIQLASFTDGQTEIINGKALVRNRGEIIASMRWLSTRWSWKSLHKVIDFIELLRSHEMVVVDKENGISKIRLVNFERHNSIGEGDYQEKNSKGNTKRNGQPFKPDKVVQDEGTLKGTPTATVREHPGNSEGTNYNKVNKVNKENNGLGGDKSPSPAQDIGKLEQKQLELKKRQQEFYDQLVPFVSKFSKAMLRAFYDYWSEPNKSRTKMKMEMQPTWDLQKRLDTWERNEYKFNKSHGSGEGKFSGHQVKKADKSFDDNLKYLYSRFLEGQLDTRVIKPEYYDKLVTHNHISPGLLESYPGDTIEFFKAKQASHVGLPANA